MYLSGAEGNFALVAAPLAGLGVRSPIHQLAFPGAVGLVASGPNPTRTTPFLILVATVATTPHGSPDSASRSLATFRSVPDRP